MKVLCFPTVLMMIVAIVECYISPQDFIRVTEKTKKPNIYSKVHTIGRTVNNNQLLIFTITKYTFQNLSQLAAKPTIVINSYMHAREPYSLDLAFKLYENMLTDKMPPALDTFLQTGLIIFYPFVNPDGFKQLTKPNSRKQEIRKNFNKGDKKCQSGSVGVDINRNFDSSFGTILSSSDPCNEQYRGIQPFSEQQAQVFKQIFKTFKVVMAIDIHSYGNQWIYPYASDAKQQKIQNHPLFEAYKEVVKVFRENNFTIQSCFQSLGYTADGVYIDWALDQGAFSLAYEVGKTFNSDPNINEQVQYSLKQFYTLFQFLQPKVISKQVGATLSLTSKSIIPLKVKIVFDSSQLQSMLNPAQSSSFTVPSNSSSVKVFIGKKEILASKLLQKRQLLDSKLIIYSVLIALTFIYFLFYKLGKVEGKNLKRGPYKFQQVQDIIQVRYDPSQQGNHS